MAHDSAAMTAEEPAMPCAPWVRPLSAATAARDEHYHAIARFG